MRSAPVVRVRVFSFLYYGLKRFEMHTVVEIIPLLLHTSLLFFFAHPVAFLVPVNVVITAVAGIILVTVIAGYTLLTLLLIHLDCPYLVHIRPHSPAVSGAPVRLCKYLASVVFDLVGALPEGRNETMVEGVFRQAIKRSKNRSAQDQQALIWTVKSLQDDNEVEPLIEAIPVVLWAPEQKCCGSGIR
jgi:hypothetical protein